MLLANFNGKEHLRHRAVSLRQHGFLVINKLNVLSSFCVSVTFSGFGLSHCIFYDFAKQNKYSVEVRKKAEKVPFIHDKHSV